MPRGLLKVKFRQQVQISREGAALGIPYVVPCYEMTYNEFGTVTCDGKIVGREVTKLEIELVKE